MSMARFEQTKEKMKVLVQNIASENEEICEQEQTVIDEKNRLAKAIENIKKMENGTILPVPFELINLDKNRRSDKDISTNQEFFQLVESIREVGIIHRPVITCDETSIFPLEGHRRILALKHLGMQIECEVRHLKSEELQILLSLSANTVRKDWDIVSTSKAINDLYVTGKYTNEKLGEILHKDRKTIERLRKIARWNDTIANLIKDNSDSLSSRFLLDLASKNKSEDDVMKSINSKLGLIKDEEKPITLSPIEKKYTKYIQTKSLSPENIAVLNEALVELKILSKDFVFNPLSN